jgi:protein TonB
MHQERVTLTLEPTTRVYFEFQVERPVTVVPGNRAPRYPAELRSNHVMGEVLVQFVVDSSGRALPGTEHVLRSTHDGFTNAVLAMLPTYRFEPARLGGQPVAQVVQMPFYFNVTR